MENLFTLPSIANRMPEADGTADVESGVRCLLFNLWSGLPMMDVEIKALLEGTWVATVLGRMKDHHNRTQAARRAHAEFQAAAPQKRRKDTSQGATASGST
jgi:hypothetical protein